MPVLSFLQAPDSIAPCFYNSLRKYYACFTGLFVSTHVKRLFYAKQIPVEPVKSTATTPVQTETAKTKSLTSRAGQNLYRCRRAGWENPSAIWVK